MSANPGKFEMLKFKASEDYNSFVNDIIALSPSTPKDSSINFKGENEECLVDSFIGKCKLDSIQDIIPLKEFLCTTSLWKLLLLPSDQEFAIINPKIVNFYFSIPDRVSKLSQMDSIDFFLTNNFMSWTEESLLDSISESNFSSDILERLIFGLERLKGFAITKLSCIDGFYDCLDYSILTNLSVSTQRTFIAILFKTFSMKNLEFNQFEKIIKLLIRKMRLNPYDLSSLFMDKFVNEGLIEYIDFSKILVACNSNDFVKDLLNKVLQVWSNDSWIFRTPFSSQLHYSSCLMSILILVTPDIFTTDLEHGFINGVQQRLEHSDGQIRLIATCLAENLNQLHPEVENKLDFDLDPKNEIVSHLNECKNLTCSFFKNNQLPNVVNSFKAPQLNEQTVEESIEPEIYDEDDLQPISSLLKENLNPPKNSKSPLPKFLPDCLRTLRSNEDCELVEKVLQKLPETFSSASNLTRQMNAASAFNTILTISDLFDLKNFDQLRLNSLQSVFLDQIKIVSPEIIDNLFKSNKLVLSQKMELLTLISTSAQSIFSTSKTQKSLEIAFYESENVVSNQSNAKSALKNDFLEYLCFPLMTSSVRHFRLFQKCHVMFLEKFLWLQGIILNYSHNSLVYHRIVEKYFDLIHLCLSATSDSSELKLVEQIPIQKALLIGMSVTLNSWPVELPVIQFYPKLQKIYSFLDEIVANGPAFQEDPELQALGSSVALALQEISDPKKLLEESAEQLSLDISEIKITNTIKIKEGAMAQLQNNRAIIGGSDSEDDNVPLSKKLKLMKESKTKKPETAPTKPAIDSSSEEDLPLSEIVKRIQAKEEKKALVEVPKTSKAVIKAEPKKKTEKTEKKVIKQEKKPSKELITVPKQPKKKVVKEEVKLETEAKEPAENGASDDEEEDDEYKWWENPTWDDTVKWETLEHSGVYFPPEYQPHGVKMLYNGKEVALEPEAEEVAGFFAALIETDYSRNPTFVKNFFDDFKACLERINSRAAPIIKDFSKCDFTPMFRHFENLKIIKKNMTKEEKNKLKDEKKALDEEYGICILDGRKEKVGNFRIEPPGLFRGRGQHPKTGKLKLRVKPEDITINIGKGAKIPPPPPGHQWKDVVHNNTVTWLATWTENINGVPKYVQLGATSSLKGKSDYKKFETARRLKHHIGSIRTKNAEELRSKEMAVRQRATALWLIDHLAIRAGNEKGDDEADTVGCCSLRLEHVSLNPASSEVTFDFLGKDSIRYLNTVKVDPVIVKNLAIFMRPPKTSSDMIFDRLDTTMLNSYLTSLMPGLTAKVFRTYNASFTMQKELEKSHDQHDASVAEKLLSYNRANREVAILCNHQRAVAKSHDQSMTKLNEKIMHLKYHRLLLNRKLNEKDAEESDIDEEAEKRIIKEIEAIEIEKYRKKMEKDGKEPDPDFVPPTPCPAGNKVLNDEALQKRIDSLSVRIQASRHQATDREENKTTALGTSKINYIDPRITAAWCKVHSVPIEKMFTKTLRDKFKWAMDVPEEWRF